MKKKQDIDSVTGQDLFSQVGQDWIKKVREKEAIGRKEVLSSWARLESRLEKKQASRVSLRRRYLFSAVAASVALLLAAGIGFWGMEKTDDSMSLSLLDKEISGLNADEVQLIAQNNRMQLKDQSSVRYGKDGQADLDEHVVKKITEPEGQGKEEADAEAVNQLIVPKGRKVDITFSDGTKMYVNSGSRVIYPVLFKKDRREILVEGEVYLEVRKDSSRPFIVKTKDLEVKVLGTQFNVCAYEEDATASVVLVEGKVEVETVDHAKTTLAPNQQITVNENGTDVREVDVFEYICWKDNMMLLSDRAARDVFDKLSRHYGRQIIWDETIGGIPISGKLDLRENPEEVIEILCQLLYLTYHVDENQNIVITKK